VAFDTSALESTLKAVGAAATLAAGAAYGTMHLAASTYYEAFGLTPEQAGVSQGTLVASSLAVVAVVGGSISLCALVAWATATLIRPYRVLRALVPLGVVLVFAALQPARSSLLVVALVAPFGVGIMLGASQPELPRLTLSLSSRRRTVAAALASVAVAGIAVVGIRTTAYDMGTFVVDRGALPTGDARMLFVGLAVNTLVRPVESGVENVDCAVAVARKGENLWIIEKRRDADNKATRTMRKVSAADVQINLEPELLRCWDD